MRGLEMTGNVLPAAPPEAICRIAEVKERVRQREAELPEEERFAPQMEHVLHAGMYARTCRLDANVLIVSVLIKVPTMLVVNGSTWVYAGEDWYLIEGYHCMAAAAGREQIYFTRRPTEITMLFPTCAKTVEEAEKEFTDETDSLLSRKQENRDIVLVTGESR